MNKKCLKISAIPKTAEELTGIKGCHGFTCHVPINDTSQPPSMEEISGIPGCSVFLLYPEYKLVKYERLMNDIALRRKRIELKPCSEQGYDFEGEGCYWRREWLKDIREESN